MNKTILQSILFTLFLMVVIIAVTFPVQAFGQAGTLTFTDEGHHGNTLTDGDASSTDITGISYNIYGIDNVGAKVGDILVLAYTGFLDSHYFFVDDGSTMGLPIDKLVIESEQGETFALKSFNVFDELSEAPDYLITGFRGGISVATQTQNLNSGDNIQISLNTDFENVDRVEIANQNGDIIESFNTFVFENSTAEVIAPTVTTESPSNVSTNSAILGGNVTNDGGVAVTERGIVYSTSADPTTADNKVEMGNGTGSFSQNVTDLDPGTTYYVRAYAINSEDTSYGNNIEFSTLSIFAGGAGTDADPYQVATAEQLDAVRDYLDSHFIQTANIDLGVSPWNDDEGWEPIEECIDEFDGFCERYEAFTGSYNGQGFEIQNLFINRPSNYNVGLFRFMDGTISNVGLVSVDITGDGRAGAIAGYTEGGNISKSYSTGFVKGGNGVGGLVGYAGWGTSIENSYSTADVEGNNEIGGFVGIMQGDAINNSYSTGSVTASSSGLDGGFIGSLVEGSISNSFWDTETSSYTNSPGRNETESTGATGKSSQEMKTKSTFTDSGWNFDTVWQIKEPQSGHISYPYHQSNPQDPAPGLIDAPSNIATSSPTSITPTSAILGGNVADVGGAAVTDRGIVWSTTSEPDVNDNKEEIGDGTGDFSTTVDLLPFGTEIFYRAYAVNDEGTAYGDEKSFETGNTLSVELTGVEGWRMLSVPAEVSLEDFLTPIWTQGITSGGDVENGEPNVYTWDYTSTYQGEGDSSTEGWDEVTNLTNTTLSAGQGVLVKVFEDDDYQAPGVVGGFPKSLPIMGSEFLSANPDMNTNEDGWTLLGNPFAVPMSWDQITFDGIKDAIYVWDPNIDEGVGGQPDDQNSGSWKTYSGGTGDLSGIIAPFQGFFVQTDGAETPSASFTQEHKTTDTAPFLGKQSQNDPIVRLEMHGQGMSNSAWLRFSPHGQSGETAGDAFQLTPLSTNYALLATQKNDQLFDIGHFPFGEDVEIPIVTEATKTGMYTLRVTNFEGGMELYLNDRQTGESLRLEENSSYEFTLNHTAKIPADPFFNLSERLQKTGVNEHRFTITTSPKTVGKDSDLPNSITLNQNYPNPFNPTTTISYELPETNRVQLHVYDLTGRQIATLVDGQVPAGTHRVNFDASNLSSGVYIYRLTAGEKQFTRRLTLVK